MRKKIYKNTKYWVSIMKASKLLKVSRQYIRALNKRGQLPFVFPHDSSMASGITRIELARLGKKTSKTEMYVGGQLRSLAKKFRQNYCKSLEELYETNEIFTGTTYVGESIVRSTSFKTFMFACAGIYNYNEVIKRFRPKELLCHLVLCEDNSGTAKNLKKKLDHWYPGVTITSTKAQIYKVKNYYAKLETSNH